MHTHHGRPASGALPNRACAGLFRFAATAVAIMLAIAGCSGGSGSSVSGAATGAALVTVTDAPGDFLSYLVNVVSLELTRADGAVVETVPNTTQIDFAQLVNLSEVVSADQIPKGTYVAASLTLDFSNASLVVDNGAGGLTVAAGNIINGGSNAPLVAPSTKTTVSLQFPAMSPLVITPGSIANLALDFNLAASNSVAPATIDATTAASTVTVTVNPVLTASLVPDTAKQIRVRGPLVSVSNTGTDTSYTVNVRPFYGNSGTRGQLVVNTTATTTFIVNGTTSAGAAGLTAMSALAAGTVTAATGTFDVSTKTFIAGTVTAGGGAQGTDLDTVEGTVIARSANVLTVSAGLVCPRDSGAAEFRPRVAVTVAAGTRVTKTGQTGAFGPQDISVGQHVEFFGTLGTDDTGSTTLDATAGSAELTATSVWGQVESSTADSITLTLQSLDGRAGPVFDFSGTGTTPAEDAAASGYVVSVPAGLLTSPPETGASLELLGFVTPFGAAPPDFMARSLVSFADTAARLRLEWPRAGITAPFEAPLSASNVVLSQTTLQRATAHVLRVGPQQLDPSLAATGLRLVPNAAATPPAATPTAFAIAHAATHRVATYGSFADVITALTTDLGTAALIDLEAKGPYDAGTGVLSVNELIVVLAD